MNAGGIYPTWISIQNEPDWNTNGHPVCLFRASEEFECAGYYKAFDTVYDTLRAPDTKLERIPEVCASNIAFQVPKTS